jgi:hypothetical protein
MNKLDSHFDSNLVSTWGKALALSDSPALVEGIEDVEDDRLKKELVTKPKFGLLDEFFVVGLLEGGVLDSRAALGSSVKSA